jgi:nucleotide-binding universal stress UspA family protein
MPSATDNGTFGPARVAENDATFVLINVERKGNAMYDKILAAIDESDVADRVLMAASELAALSQGEVLVLHLREREPSKFGVTSAESAGEAQALVDAAVGKLSAAGIRAQGHARDTLFGHAAQEIINDAKANEIGVIVVGSRGHGDLAGLLLGSTAHKVIHLSDKPVLVVR